MVAEWRKIKAWREDAKAVMDVLKEWEKGLTLPIREKWEAERAELEQKKLPREQLYALVRQSRNLEADELKQVKADVLSDQAELRASLQAKPATWIHFLRGKAAQGDEIALAVLKKDNIPVEEEIARYSARPLHKGPDRGGLFAEWQEIKAWREGAKADMGLLKEWEIRFTAHDRPTKAAALLFAQAKWGKGIRLEGNQICREDSAEYTRG